MITTLKCKLCSESMTAQTKGDARMLLRNHYVRGHSEIVKESIELRNKAREARQRYTEFCHLKGYPAGLV